MNDVLLTPIRLNELEALIENSVKRALKKSDSSQIDGQTIENPLNMDDLQKLTGYSRQTLYGYCQKSSIPHHKKNGRLFFFKSEIIDWIKQGRQKMLNDIVASADDCLSDRRKHSNLKKG